jgi:serine/threonine-protein kinase
VTDEPLIFGKYKLLEPLGRGGMAEVYRALSVGAAGFKRPVVIKRILPSLAANRQFVDMFIKEASIAASLDHPNIVQVFDLGEDGSDLFMVLEYVPGLDLGSIVQHFAETGRRLPHQIVAFLAVDVCKALECAHDHRDADGNPAPVIHRDVSPQNVLISMAGMVKLADFGLAMALTDARVTLPGIIKGKLGYLSPEQALGARELDVRSDLFSLGVVLYEAIAGRRLFTGESPVDTIRRIRDVKFQSLSRVAPQVPDQLVELIHGLLSKDPEGRPGSAKEVRKVLARYLRHVHPPVDATALASIVRHIVRERAASKNEPSSLDKTNDDVVTAAYAVEDAGPDSFVDDSSANRETLAQDGVPTAPPQPLELVSDDPDPTLQTDPRDPSGASAPRRPAEDPSASSSVLISRVVSVGDASVDPKRRGRT